MHRHAVPSPHGARGAPSQPTSASERRASRGSGQPEAEGGTKIEKGPSHCTVTRASAVHVPSGGRMVARDSMREGLPR